MKVRIIQPKGDDSIVFSNKNKKVVARLMENGGYCVYTDKGQFVCPSPLELLSIQLGFLCRRDDFEVDNNVISQYVHNRFVFCEKKYILELERKNSGYLNTINLQKTVINKTMKENERYKKQIEKQKSEILELQNQNIELQKRVEVFNIKKFIKKWLKR